MRVNIDELDRAAVLAALFNASRQQGRGFLDERGRQPLTVDRAREILVDAGPDAQFDYLMGRVLKISLPVGATEVDCRLYDRDNGPDAGLLAVTSLRSTNNPNNPLIQFMHEDGTFRARRALEESLEQRQPGALADVVGEHFRPSMPKRQHPDDEELRG